MAADFLTLLERDHRDLAGALDELIAPASLAQIRSALDGVRLGLTAHAEAEDIVLYRALASCPNAARLEPFVGQARAAHLAQEAVLRELVCLGPSHAGWRALAERLRELVVEHAAWEERHVVAAIREAAPELYASLAGAFATERLRQLSMLQPSAVFQIPELARAS
jgi:hemerythrin HHE cation binding domain-containing protein